MQNKHRTASSRHPLVFLAPVFVALPLLAGCAETGPTTAAEVCDDYRALVGSVRGANGFFDNAIFNRAADLGSSASRLPGSAHVRSDGERLAKIGDSDGTTVGDLEDASLNVAALCSESPLSIGLLFGS